MSFLFEEMWRFGYGDVNGGDDSADDLMII